MFISAIILLAILSATVFVLPKRLKVWSTAAVIGLGAIAAVSEALLVFGSRWDKWQGGGSSVLFGSEFARTDSLSALFMILISLCAVAVVIYSKGYMKSYLERKSSIHISIHYFSMSILFISLLLVVTVQGGYGFLFSWELMTISSFVLMLLDAHKREVRKAALGYLVMMHIGFVLLLVGFVLLYIKGLPVNFDSLRVYAEQYNYLPIFILFLLGFGMKAGIFPLHIWIPSSYQNAPDHVAAFMSGAVGKMGIYGLIRIVSMMESNLATIGVILLVIGVVTGIWGVILSTLQSDIKRLLAYSSIENVGIIVLAIGVAIIGKANNNSMLALCGLAGALLHTLNHSMFKTLLFFGSGNVVSQTGTSSIESLGGVAKRMPLTATIFLFGVIAICALPPLSGFASEFIIYFGLLDTIAANSQAVIASICAVVALSLIGGVVLLAFTKLYGVVFLGTPRTEAVEKASEVDRFRIAACALPITGILIIGVMPVVVVGAMFSLAADLMAVGGVETYYGMIHSNLWGVSITVGVLILSSVILYVYKKCALRNRKVGSSPTWACGYSGGDSRMQYSGESFAEGLHSITPSLTKNIGENGAVDKDELFPVSHSFNRRHKDKVDSLFEAWWVALLHRINSRVMSLRTGKVNYQVLYALLFLMLILTLSLLNLL